MFSTVDLIADAVQLMAQNEVLLGRGYLSNAKAILHVVPQRMDNVFGVGRHGAEVVHQCGGRCIRASGAAVGWEHEVTLPRGLQGFLGCIEGVSNQRNIAMRSAVLASQR